MSNSQRVDRKLLYGILEDYCEAPTTSNQARLLQGAEAYREHWIGLKSAEPRKAEDPATEEAGGATRYKRIVSIEGRQPDGTELTLALQSRTSRVERRTWYVVSWRTRLSPGGHNRRFYRTEGSLWTLPSKTALDMLQRLENAGGFAPKYEDTERRPDFRVRVLSGPVGAEQAALLEEITLPEEDWGAAPFVVVLDDPNAHWRKIMLVDRESGIATFRSTTTDSNYMPRVAMRPGSSWFLDNSMQDINVQQARVFLEKLRAAKLTAN